MITSVNTFAFDKAVGISSRASELAAGVVVSTAMAASWSSNPKERCKAVVQIAADDIAIYNTTGELSSFLKEATIKAANLNRETPEKVLQTILELYAEMNAAN